MPDLPLLQRTEKHKKKWADNGNKTKCQDNQKGCQETQEGKQSTCRTGKSPKQDCQEKVEVS